MLVALLVEPSLFARLFARKCSFAVLKSVATLESSKRSFATNLSTFLIVLFGCPCLDFRYFRIQDSLFCC